MAKIKIDAGALYLVSFIGNDVDIFDRYISIVSQDKEAKYKSGKWIMTSDTVNKILNTIPEASITIEKYTDVIEDKDIEIGKVIKANLYPYQKEIAEYCLKNQKAIIVAPCGAGKTVIAIDTFLDAIENNIISKNSKGIIVVKTSLKIQWKKEIEKFSDLKPIVIDTYKSSIGYLQTKINKLNAKIKSLLKSPVENMNKIIELESQLKTLTCESDNKFNSMFSDEYDLYIVSYDTLKDPEVRKALHKKKNIEFISCDEIHLIKSDTSKRTKALWEFADIKLRFGATATPIQKNPLDAFSLAKFISPETWHSKSAFASRYVNYCGYGRVSGSKNEKELNQKLSQFMIVKTKEEVSKQLPSLIPIVRYCSLSDQQLKMTDRLMSEIKYYKEQEKSLLANGKSPTNEELLKIQANIMARQTFASELATSEELLKVSESDMAKKYITNSKSNKIELLLELLDEIIESGEKVAIFSKYQRLQPILEQEILNKYPNIKIASAHGGLDSQQRYEEVYTKFQDTDDYKVLLLTDAFCEGVNLRKAKYLIEMEPADSYLVQTQRRGRIERADSVYDTVFVYQLVAEKSYDEIGLKIVEKKQRYDSQIIKGNL